MQNKQYIQRVIHGSNDFDNANEVIEEIFESLISRYQIGLETSLKGSDIIFDSIQLLYSKCHTINFNWINKYNWERIKYPSKIDDWKMFEKNNPTIALNF